MAGPIDGGTRVKFYGYGYMASIPRNTELYVRFGSFDSQLMEKTNVNEGEKWSDDNYHNELNIPKGILSFTEANDEKIEEEQGLRSYFGAMSPNLKGVYSVASPDYKTYGGPMYVQLSEKVPILSTVHPSSSKTKTEKQRRLAEAGGANTYTDYIETTYADSSNLEFYFYR